MTRRICSLEAISSYHTAWCNRTRLLGCLLRQTLASVPLVNKSRSGASASSARNPVAELEAIQCLRKEMLWGSSYLSAYHISERCNLASSEEPSERLPRASTCASIDSNTLWACYKFSVPSARVCCVLDIPIDVLPYSVVPQEACLLCQVLQGNALLLLRMLQLIDHSERGSKPHKRLIIARACL